MRLKLFYIVLLCIDDAWLDNVGWKSYLKENPTEFHDIPLVWEGNKSVPDWLSGTYIRNGPAQISFGSSRRVLTSWLDGYAKLHSFKMSGSSILYSGAMLKSPNYVDSVEKGELVPSITLNKFNTDEEEWTWWELLQIIYKSMVTMDESGNNNPALWRIGPENEGIYLAVTDAKVATRFNISDLSTIGQEYPARYPLVLNGCAHWMREVGTDNSIYFNYKKGFTGPPWVEVLRYTPESSFQDPEVIAKFKPTKFSYIHSFSITENYAIFLFYPVKIDPKRYFESKFHVFELFDGSNMTDTTDVFVVNLKSGDVKGPFPSPWVYSAHHINAYEKSDSEIVLDMCPTPFENMREYLKLDNMLNPPEELNDIDISTTGGSEITRYDINVKSGKVKTSTFPNIIKNRFINTFDFPTINEDYRGKKYCYTYGMSAFAYSRTALVKKDVCTSKEDKVWNQENHYMSEMHFLPKPGGKEEDDGVLITIGFDGTKEQSYLMFIDAKTFTPINHAYLPHNIPWSAHGMYFPEANLHYKEVANELKKMQKQEL